MTPSARPAAHRDSSITVHLGDVRTVLATLPAASVDCCVTSPPYWGLRDYDLEPQRWGGDDGCRHAWDRSAGGSDGGWLCTACGAWLGHLGLEPTPEQYVNNLVEVFRAVRRVLKPSATLWLNLGDCYNSGTSARRRPTPSRQGYWRTAGSMGDRRVRAMGVKTKDLVGIPWRVALALQADGWYLRSDVIWSKPNPMPESVTDRPTRAHEYLFLLAPGPRYFYDAEAIRESPTMTPQRRLTPRNPDHDRAAERPEQRRPRYALRQQGAIDGDPAGRNRRTVWTIATQPYRGAHFATFPERLVEPCILAGTSEAGCCPICGKPWRRVVRVTYVNPGNRGTNGPRSQERRRETAGFAVRLERRASTAAWQPSCACEMEPEPAVVLDPFAGSGTTLAVSAALGRGAIGIELSPAYIELIRERCRPMHVTQLRRAA